MPTCEISGKETDELVTRIIGGAELQVCEDYAHLGEPVEDEGEDGDDPEDTPSEIPPHLVDDVAERVTEARDKTNLSIEELADRLSLDVDYLEDIETGEAFPDSTARAQLEQFLNITLLSQDDEEAPTQ